MVTKVIGCPHRGSEDVVKNDFAPNGKQKYLCHACGRQSRESPSPNGYTQERKEETCAPTRRSDRACAGSGAPSASRPPPSSAGSKRVATLELEDTLLFAEVPEQSKILELDEPWSFVYRKSDKVWVWLALCRETRQVVAFVTSYRSRQTCERLWRAIPESYKRRRPATATPGKPIGK